MKWNRIWTHVYFPSVCFHSSKKCVQTLAPFPSGYLYKWLRSKSATCKIVEWQSILLFIYYFLMGTIFDPKKILWFLLRSLQSSREQRTAHESVREQWIQRLLCSETQHSLQKREMWRLEGLTVPREIDTPGLQFQLCWSRLCDLDRVFAYPKTFVSSLIIWEWSLPFAPG